MNTKRITDALATLWDRTRTGEIPTYQAPVAADKVLNTTTTFAHWKKITIEHHPQAVFVIVSGKAVAKIGDHVCAKWDAAARKGVVLHNEARNNAA